jgi:hypothetical protein
LFPFLAPEVFLKQIGIELTPEFLQTLAEQNTWLMMHGLIKADV